MEDLHRTSQPQVLDCSLLDLSNIVYINKEYMELLHHKRENTSEFLIELDSDWIIDVYVYFDDCVSNKIISIVMEIFLSIDMGEFNLTGHLT